MGTDVEFEVRTGWREPLARKKSRGGHQTSRDETAQGPRNNPLPSRLDLQNLVLRRHPGDANPSVRTPVSHLNIVQLADVIPLFPFGRWMP